MSLLYTTAPESKLTSRFCCFVSLAVKVLLKVGCTVAVCTSKVLYASESSYVLQCAARARGGLDGALFDGDLHTQLAECPTAGLGAAPAPDVDGALPPVWSLQQAALWPALIASQRSGLLTDALGAFAKGATAAVRAALAAHVQACAAALLRGDRTAGHGGTRPASSSPPPNAAMEEQLRWLRPSAALALLQSVLLLMRALRWFYGGCGALAEAALVSVGVRVASLWRPLRLALPTRA